MALPQMRKDFKIRQGGKLYRATKFLSVVADTLSQIGSITGLKENDFIAIDGKGITHFLFEDAVAASKEWSSILSTISELCIKNHQNSPRLKHDS